MPQRLSPIGLEATSRNPAQAAPSGLAASGSGVPKSAAGNAAVERRFPSTDSVGAASRYQAAQRQTARASQATRPSLHAQAAADQPVRRAMREAATPSSPIAAENLVRSAASSAPHTVEVAASSTALNKAQTGTAGRGASLNLGLADPSADSPATVASGSAQRAEATQNIPAGPALDAPSPGTGARWPCGSGPTKRFAEGHALGSGNSVRQPRSGNPERACQRRIDSGGIRRDARDRYGLQRHSGGRYGAHDANR